MTFKLRVFDFFRSCGIKVKTHVKPETIFWGVYIYIKALAEGAISGNSFFAEWSISIFLESLVLFVLATGSFPTLRFPSDEIRRIPDL